MRSAVVVILTLAAAACTDFPTPAQLEKPTILAIVADPPVVASGGEARLAAVVVDGTGVLGGPSARYRLIATYAGVAPIGRIVDDAGAVRYLAPDPVPTLPGGAPAVDTIEVTIDGAGDAPLTALKRIEVGTTATRNPEMTRFAVGDGDALAGPLTVRRGETRALEIATDPAPSDEARFAWYAVAGTIERYQSNPSELVVGDDARSGWMFVVMRDGRGGTAWRGVELRVE